MRVSRDIRLIVHRSANSLLLCYVDHHDKAYQWAERRKLETHPQTGAAQLVEIRERVQEIAVPTCVAEERQAPIKAALFENVSEEDLLAFGVPAEWLDDVRNADEDQLLEIADHLPGEAAEALLELAIGGRPQRPAVAIGAIDPFDHPDAQRRFRVMADADELALALEYPWEKWAVFLHPAQRDIVEKDYNGPARVSGSAGTGKTKNNRRAPSGHPFGAEQSGRASSFDDLFGYLGQRASCEVASTDQQRAEIGGAPRGSRNRWDWRGPV